MCFLSYSQVWVSNFGLEGAHILEKSFYEVMPNAIQDLKTFNDENSKGKSYASKTEKFIHPNGQTQWLNWKISPWNNDNGEFAGLLIISENITEQKREQELLIKAQSVARIGGWEFDLITNKIYWTAVTREIHELSEDYEPNLEDDINFYKVGKFRETLTRHVTDAITEGKPWDDELILVTAKGNEVWVRSKGEAEVVGDKRVRLFGTIQDIDEKKKAQLKYQKTTKRLQMATATSQIGVWEYDFINNKVYWDDSMYPIYKILRSNFDLEYRTWRSRMHPDDIESVDQEIAMAVSGEKEVNCTFRIIWPSGEVRYIRVIAATHRTSGGKPTKMVGTNWDITELKTTQMMLHENEASFQGAFVNSNTGMTLCTIKGKFLQVNASFSKMLGYTIEEFKSLTFLDISHPDDVDKDVKLFREIISGKRESYQTEKRYFTKKGQLVYGVLTVTAVKNFNGENIRFLGQIVDVTAQIESTHKLNQLIKVANKQNESLMNFAHIVSHNLRSHSSNLSMIYNFIEAEKNQEEKENLLKMIGESSQNLSETVNHLNEVIQVKTNASIELMPINLFSTLEGVQKSLSLLLEEKSPVISIKIPKSLHVLGRPAYLESIFLNLFTNSLKYSSPKRQTKISISFQKIDKKLIVVKFRDNGVGIDLDKHGKKIFGMYKTFHGNKDAQGIGLFMTKNQIEAINGKIEVESQVDKGTTFKLYFQKKESQNNKSTLKSIPKVISNKI
jgi:PAS domain S-box-containing protein